MKKRRRTKDSDVISTDDSFGPPQKKRKSPHTRTSPRRTVNESNASTNAANKTEKDAHNQSRDNTQSNSSSSGSDFELKSKGPDDSTPKNVLHTKKTQSTMDYRSIGFIELGTGEVARQRKNSSRQRKNSSQYKRYHPVIRLHPDEVPQQIKDLWVKATAALEVPASPRTRSSARREQSATVSSPPTVINKELLQSKYIVYKYGICTKLTEEDDHHFQFLIVDPSRIIPYSDGITHNYDCIPHQIMNQLGSGKPLNDVGYRLVQALEVLKLEVRREPKDRVQWMEEFLRRQREENRKCEEAEKLKAKQLAIEKSLALYGEPSHVKLKKYITSHIPEEVTGDFGRVGFARYDDFFFPVIQLSPFDLSPSCFRSEWMRMFNAWDTGRMDEDSTKGDENASTTSSTDASSVGTSFLRLVYWYGQDHNEKTREISLLHEDDFISYYDGIKKVAKFSSTWDIPLDMERYLKTGIREAESDLKLPVNDRVAWLKKIEIEKKKILNSIPAEVTNDFRSVGWVYHSKTYLPVIILTPFDVTGDVKDNYLEHIRKSVKAKQPVKRLVLWYGTQEKDRFRAFGFKRSSDIISYEEGRKRGLHIVPSNILEKMKSGEKLTYKQFLVAFGLKQLEKDVLLSREERPFALMLPDDMDECWEMLDDDDDDDDYEEDSGQEDIEDDCVEIEEDECSENTDSEKDDDESEKLFSTSEEEDDDDEED